MVWHSFCSIFFRNYNLNPFLFPVFFLTPTHFPPFNNVLTGWDNRSCGWHYCQIQYGLLGCFTDCTTFPRIISYVHSLQSLSGFCITLTLKLDTETLLSSIPRAGFFFEQSKWLNEVSLQSSGLVPGYGVGLTLRRQPSAASRPLYRLRITITVVVELHAGYIVRLCDGQQHA